MLYALEDRVPQVDADAWVADNATVIGSVQLAAASSVWFNAVLRGDCDDIVIGPRSNVQDGAVLHTDSGIRLVVGSDVTIGHQVMLHGCEIGDQTLIGIQSIVLNGAKIGRNCIVGAGSFIAEGKTFPDGVLILGSPAVVKRELKPFEIQMIDYAAKHYVQNAARFRRGLRALPPA